MAMSPFQQRIMDLVGEPVPTFSRGGVTRSGPQFTEEDFARLLGRYHDVENPGFTQYLAGQLPLFQKGYRERLESLRPTHEAQAAEFKRLQGVFAPRFAARGAAERMLERPVGQTPGARAALERALDILPKEPILPSRLGRFAARKLTKTQSFEDYFGEQIPTFRARYLESPAGKDFTFARSETQRIAGEQATATAERESERATATAERERGQALRSRGRTVYRRFR